MEATRREASRPSRARELKRLLFVLKVARMASRPSRARELKRYDYE